MKWYSDVEELLADASIDAVVVATNNITHMMTENVFNRRAMELVRSRVLGAVVDSRFHMEFLFGSTPSEASSWRCSRLKELGGPIGDVGSHCLYLAEFIFGEPIIGIACVYYPKTLAIAEIFDFPERIPYSAARSVATF